MNKKCLERNDCRATVVEKWKLFPFFLGRIKSRLAHPTLLRHCVLLQFITGKIKM